MLTNAKILIAISVLAMIFGWNYWYNSPERVFARQEIIYNSELEELSWSIQEAKKTIESWTIRIRNLKKCIDNKSIICNVEKSTTTGSVIPEASKSFNEINLWSNLEQLHDTICKKQINSPLCKDKELFARLYRITEDRLPMKQFYPILIGMTNAESSLWLDFAKDKVWGTCVGRNNWGGAKYMIKDDNTRVYKRNLNWFDYKYPRDQYDCNLFPFESIEEYWTSKVNWIRYWYKGCIDSPTPIKCISGKYVWDPNVQEQGWINNVSIFLNN